VIEFIRISIPYGAIKSFDIDVEKSMREFISIPYGAIKRNKSQGHE